MALKAVQINPAYTLFLNNRLMKFAARQKRIISGLDIDGNMVI